MIQTHKTISQVGVAVLLGLLVAVFPASASQQKQALVNPGGNVVTIPSQAIQVAPNIFSLGTTFDKQSGEVVEGYMIVRPYKGNKKPSDAPGGGGGGTGGGDPAASCYGFLATGAKWKTVEPWVVNTANNSGLGEASVFSILSSSIGKWEAAASFDIIGAGTSTFDTLVADETSTDGKNEVYFGSLGDNNTIGVTIVWGVFGGPTRNRKLVEWDQVYNTYYNWSDTGASDKMDFESIATHELGHSVGLADLYTSACSEQTMYGYGSEGETKARTLEVGDVAGINALY